MHNGYKTAAPLNIQLFFITRTATTQNNLRVITTSRKIKYIKKQWVNVNLFCLNTEVAISGRFVVIRITFQGYRQEVMLVSHLKYLVDFFEMIYYLTFYTNTLITINISKIFLVVIYFHVSMCLVCFDKECRIKTICFEKQLQPSILIFMYLFPIYTSF